MKKKMMLSKKTNVKNTYENLLAMFWYFMAFYVDGFFRIVNELSNWKSVEVWILIAKKNRKVAASFLGSTFQNDLGCITQCFKINKIVSFFYFRAQKTRIFEVSRQKKYKIFWIKEKLQRCQKWKEN